MFTDMVVFLSPFSPFGLLYLFFFLSFPSIFILTSTLVLFPLFSPPSSPSLLSPVPRVVAVSPQMRLVEDNPSSLSLVEIYKQRCTKKGIEHDNPISRYYDRLATVQARGTQASHQVGRQSCNTAAIPDVLDKVSVIQTYLAPTSAGSAGHPERSSGEHGASEHAKGVGPPHVPQCH